MAALTARGHRATPLVRPGRPGAGIRWNPAAGELEPEHLKGYDAVVHLAGENIAAGRWTEEQKGRIRESRVGSTRLLAQVLASGAGPKIFLSASAVGYYGEQGDAVLTEGSPPGSGFLAEVCQAWEQAAQPAVEAGIRVCSPRLGMVLSAQGGALARLRRIFRLGLGGKLGSGQQWMSWIDLADAVGLLLAALESDWAGPVNLVAPAPVTNAEFTAALGQAVGRPTFLGVPSFAAKLALGEMANELLLASQRVLPARAQQAGYTFRSATLSECLRHLGQFEK